jgi:hypothetical protein
LAKKLKSKGNEMTLKKEIKENVTFVSLIVMLIVGVISDNFKHFVYENAVLVIPWFIYLAVHELKGHIEKIVINVVKKED